MNARIKKYVGMIRIMGKFVSKKGHNARVTGLSMLVFGIAFALAGGYGGSDGMMSISVGVAPAGFIAFIVGGGLGRETPNEDTKQNSKTNR